MLRSIEGIFRDGKVELLEPAPPGTEGRVIVTFLSEREIDLAARGIDREQTFDSSGRLKSFSEDWDLPEMDAYDEL